MAELQAVTKAVVLIGGLGSRFLPLSKAVPKEFLPLADKPMIHYLIEELKLSGIREIIFLAGVTKHPSSSYFRRSQALEKILEERGQEEQLQELTSLQELLDGFSFSFVTESKLLGDGNAVLQARRYIKDEPFLVAYPDDVIEAKTPCALQLMNVFRTSQRPVQGLVSLPQERLSAYGVIDGSRIASRLWKVTSVVEKPPLGKAPSQLAIVGRRILTPDIFSYLKKTTANGKGEVVLTEALGKMAKDGKPIYGYEIEGRWWECGNKQGWLISNAIFSLRDPKYGKMVREAVKQEKII